MSNDGPTGSFSGQCREKQPSWTGAVRPPWSLSSPGWTITTLSAFLHWRHFPALWWFLWFLLGSLQQIHVCLVQGNPRTGNSALSGVSQKRRRGWELSPSTCCLPLLVQPRIWLAFWPAGTHCQLLSSFYFTRIPKSSSVACFKYIQPTICADTGDCPSPGVRSCTWP